MKPVGRIIKLSFKKNIAYYCRADGTSQLNKDISIPIICKSSIRDIAVL